MRHLLTAAFLAWAAIVFAAEAARGASSLDLLVSDQATGAPISGAGVHVRWMQGDMQLTTARDGHVVITVPREAISFLDITVTQHGYVGKYLIYGHTVSLAGDPVPPIYLMKLEKGTSISGRVVDEAGQPIAGAHVALDISALQLQNQHEANRLSYTDDIRTDANGNWTFDEAPVQINHASIGAWDYRYLVDSAFSMNEIKNLSSLRDGTAVVVLRSGVTVEGTVLGPDGRPAVGATVGLGDDREASNTLPDEPTDANGHFAYVVQPDSHVILTVKAKGCAPDLKEADVAGAKTEMNFKLTAGNHLRGRVVGPDDKPVAGAIIDVDSWHAQLNMNVELTTDAHGSFSWDEAPSDPVDARIMADGPMSRAVQLTAGSEAVVRLSLPSKVSGAVIDADSGRPIEQFRILREMSFDKDGPFTPDGSRAEPFTGGKFQYFGVSSYPFHVVRIDAEGYEPAKSRPFTRAEGDVSLDIKLKKGKWTTIKLLAPDGSPAAGEFAARAEPGQWIRLNNGEQLEPDQEPLKLTADAAGEINLPAINGPFLLVAFGPLGYAQADQDALTKSNTVKLTAWGRIKGRLFVGGKPAADERMSIQLERLPIIADPRTSFGVQHEIETQSGADGQYVFDRVPSGKLSIGRWIEHNEGAEDIRWYQTPMERVEIAAGQILDLQIGGHGRTIIGKMTIPPELAARSGWMWWTHTAYVDVPLIGPELPDTLKNASAADQKKWLAEYAKSDTGKAYAASQKLALQQRKYYELPVSRDGSFRGEDLLPDLYHLEFKAIEEQTGQELAAAETYFTVPAGPVDQPVEMPVVAMKMAAPASRPSP